MKRQVKHLETLKILGIEFCKDYFGLFVSVIQALAWNKMDKKCKWVEFQQMKN